MNYVCPDTGQCIDSGAWAWLQCSFTGEEENDNPEEEFAAKEVELAAKEGDFELAFVAYRIDDGILDKKLAEEEWRYFVGDVHYADKNAFTNFRKSDKRPVRRRRGRRAHAQP